MTVKRVMLITPVHPERAAAAVATASEAARAAGVQLVSTVDEHQKHVDAATHIERVADGERPDICLVLGGDGSILYALRHFAHTGVPVFGINFGTIGFLAAVEREDLANGLERVFSGDFEVLDLPGLTVDLPLDHRTALNDVSFLRQPRGRVAQLSYTIGDRRWGASAATDWSPRPRQARRATTSPTAARSWPGA